MRDMPITFNAIRYGAIPSITAYLAACASRSHKREAQKESRPKGQTEKEPPNAPRITLDTLTFPFERET
jgi:hypothetical protein